MGFAIFRRPLTPASLTAAVQPTTADHGSVLRRRQRTTTVAGDGRHDKDDCGSMNAAAVCVDGRQRRIV